MKPSALGCIYITTQTRTDPTTPMRMPEMEEYAERDMDINYRTVDKLLFYLEETDIMDEHPELREDVYPRLADIWRAAYIRGEDSFEDYEEPTELPSESPDTLLSVAFLWAESPEGHYYWENVSKKLMDH